tara:strand:- start:871 stop:2034 length:1164 start_codon:yes stop_codon:yes gene_type:complete
MKFLTVSMYSEGHGGYERHRRMSKALIEAGHQVVWLAPGIKNSAGEDFLPLIKYFSWLPGPMGWILRLFCNLRYYREHLKDINAIFTTKEYDAFGCILDKMVRGVPHIFFLHGDTIECEKYLAINSYSLSRRIKSRLMLLFYPMLQRKVLKCLSHVVVQAEFLANTLKKRHPTIPCEYTVLTTNCSFDWHPEEPNAEHIKMIEAYKEQGKFIVGIIAQVFYRAKGFDVFLDSMARLKTNPKIHAIIIGYGSEAFLIPKNIKRLGLENCVTFLGRAPAAHKLMPLIDVVASPTQFFDAFPTVILEAMDSGCCIVASDIEAHKVQLKYKELMFYRGDDTALSQSLLKLSNNKLFRERNKSLVQARKEYFQDNWDSKVVAILTSGMHQSP